ncbi:GAF domain-containing protein [Allonocardiopsis opalescens]|uniref:PAS domain S-box-containing protein n=1 Tax=Allonocardiopsis opalescens TaxID=1144618 RepID=A0A2T0Q9S5_9ACTN|nr:GAF domain-containing protein [Allonocardiopsis opalescens]PRY00562.1 PAS domain S-box-containing protein [Allonocardiopsis opalescens]
MAPQDDGGLDPAEFDRELAELAERADALRATHAAYPEDAASTLEAALAELRYAEDRLRAAGAALAELTARRPGHDRSGHDDERSLLRTVFTELAVPVLLLDHEGHIRRANTAAAELLGTSAGYLTGKPFVIFVDLRRRAAMRSQLAAVGRSGQTASFDSRLARKGWADDIHVTLSRHRLPAEQHPVTAVVLSTPVATDGDSAPPPLEPEVENQVVVLGARRLDIMARMTRLLLARPGTAADTVLERAAELLADSYADWVLIDMCDEPLRRAVVAGPDGDGSAAQAELLRGLDPADGEVPGGVLDNGHSALEPLIEDEAMLGRTPAGVPVLGMLGAGSLLSVPLRADARVLGALTLVRRSNRASFGLADLGLLEEIGEHVGLAVRNARTGG